MCTSSGSETNLHMSIINLSLFPHESVKNTKSDINPRSIFIIHSSFNAGRKLPPHTSVTSTVILFPLPVQILNNVNTVVLTVE